MPFVITCFSFQAVFAYVGSRPSQELIEKYLKILNDMTSAIVVNFIYVRRLKPKPILFFGLKMFMER
jgi:hypothetical protein